MQKNKPWSARLKVLRDFCPTFDVDSQEIGVNDDYRLEKALGWALASGGESYKRERRLGDSGGAARFDIKGVFLTGGKVGAYERMILRCDWMLANGLLEEFFAFLREGVVKERGKSKVRFF